MRYLEYLLIAASVSLAALGVLQLVVGTRLERRLRALAPPAAERNWILTAVQLVGPFARLSSPAPGWDSSPVRLRFLRAGLRQPAAPLIFYGLKTLLPLTLALLVAPFIRLSGLPVSEPGFWLLLSLAAMGGCYLPDLGLRVLTARRHRVIFEGFPDAADLMLICVEAGLGLDAALIRVADELAAGSPVLAQELHLTVLEIRAGVVRAEALRHLALRAGVDEIGVFASMLGQSERFGTRVGDALRIFSDDLRQKRQVRAEEQAAKVSVRMLFPLVLCIFPAISMVVLGPALIRITRTLLPMLAGQGLS